MRTPLKFLMALAMVTLAAGLAVAEENPFEDALAVLTEELDLSEDQQKEVAGHLMALGQGLDAAAQESEKEEPDTDKMIGDIKSARADFQKGMKGTLNDEQHAKFEAAVEQTIQGMFNDLAAIRLMDLQPALELTDDQMVALEPIIGKGLREIMGLVWENADKRLTAPRKIKLGRSLKGIQSEMEKGIAGVLDEDQLKKLQAMQEEAKG